MNAYFVNDAKAAGCQVEDRTDRANGYKTPAELLLFCHRIAEISKLKKRTIYSIRKTDFTQLIYWSTPVTAEIKKPNEDDERKAGAELWTVCLFIDGRPFFVTDELNFETLAQAVPLLCPKARQNSISSKKPNSNLTE